MYLDFVNGHFLLTKNPRAFALLDRDTLEPVYQSAEMAECLLISRVLAEVRNVVEEVNRPNEVADLIVATLSKAMESLAPAPTPAAAPAAAAVEGSAISSS